MERDESAEPGEPAEFDRGLRVGRPGYTSYLTLTKYICTQLVTSMTCRMWRRSVEVRLTERRMCHVGHYHRTISEVVRSSHFCRPKKSHTHQRVVTQSGVRMHSHVAPGNSLSHSFTFALLLAVLPFYPERVSTLGISSAYLVTMSP